MGEEEASMVAGRSMCVLFVLSAALLQVNFGAGVEMEVQMLDLDRMQQDLVEADEGNAQTLDEIHSYGNGHVDHLEQLSRELEVSHMLGEGEGATTTSSSNAPDGDDDEESDDGATTPTTDGATTTTTTTSSNAPDGDD